MNGHQSVLNRTEELVKFQRLLQESQDREREAAQVIDALERENRNLVSFVDCINRSVAWSLVGRYRFLKEKILPAGTLRRRLYDRWVTGIGESATCTVDETDPTFPEAKIAVRHKIAEPERQANPQVRGTGGESCAQYPLCSIIIPVFNRALFTKGCLSAIEQTAGTEGPSHEIIVVDNGSSDETPSLLNSWARSRQNVRVISMGRNLGFAAACNEGARLARGRYLIFLNNDTLPTPGWLLTMVCAAECDSQIGIVGSKLLFPDNRIQHVGVVFDQGKLPRHIYRGCPADIPPARVSREYQAVTAACMLVPQALYNDVRGMDERYRNSFEDIDLCMKIRAKGYRTLFCADSVVYHFEGLSEGRTANDFRNYALFAARWKNEIESDAVQWYLLDQYPTNEHAELRRAEGYNGKQDRVLEELWGRLYSVPFPTGDFGTKVPA